MGLRAASLFMLWLALSYANEIRKGRTRNHGHYVCSTWGNNHFKTFDGDIYQFPGICEYNFASDCRESYKEFSVHIQRALNSNNHPEIQYILITIKDFTMYLRPKVAVVDGRIVKTPYYSSGVLIESDDIYTKVYAKLGLTLIWNQEDALMVELDNKFNNHTCGLCGDYNGVPIYNEFINGFASYNSITYGNLQKISKPNAKCEDPDETQALPNCNGHRDECERLLTSSAFADCWLRLNSEIYIQACMQDKCACNGNEDSFCLCSTISEYSRQCSHAGGRPGEWRTQYFCPKSCPDTMIYRESSSPCMDTCSHLAISSLCEEHYMDGCFCPEGKCYSNYCIWNKTKSSGRGDHGTVYDDVTEKGCIPVSQCHCKLHGKEYSPGESITNECEECTCNSGRWTCKDLPCPGTCSVEGGSHITTFDGKKYTFHGDCYYVLAKGTVNDSHALLAELAPCGSTDRQTCLKTVVLLVDHKKNVVVFRSDGSVLLNEMTVNVPHVSASFSVFKPSSHYLIVQTSFGLQLQIQLFPVMQLFATVDQTVQGKLQGLCGNFNGMEGDDFKTTSGLVEATGSAFANTWKAQSTCTDQTEKLEDPCSLSIESANYAEHWCSLLKNPEGPFARCHLIIDPSEYYKKCKYDTCLCEDNEECLCAALSSYSRACAFKGVILGGWRKSICTNEVSACPGNQIFLYNLTMCQQTCRSLADGEKHCLQDFAPVDGCGCPYNTYLDNQDTCVPISKCPCYYKGSYLEPGEYIRKDGERCVCRNAKVHCTSVTIGKKNTTECSSDKRYFDCNTSPTWTSQTPVQLSCHTPRTDHFQAECVSGCVCPDGLFDDGKGGCVQEKDCPCIHNNQWYSSGQKITVDCNTCVCQKGSWSCTEYVCYGTCTIYGSGHYITFDGKFYDFDGRCEYVATQDFCGDRNSSGSFSIITENVPCGTTGVTCSKAIKIFLGKTELKLEDKDYKEIQRDIGDDVRYWNTTVGLYLVIEASNGVMLIWDKKTTVFIKLTPDYKGKVCGLCGNFDDKSNNDFTTRSGVQETNALKFGNSWKQSSTCPDVTEEIKPCDVKPHRESWAKKECNIIRSDVFKICHSKVDPNPFYDACVHDACSCDSGGDCECFCSAVAAYAQECTKAQACVFWRTPDICPIFCDYYNPRNECDWHYEPCGSNVTTCRMINNVSTNFTVPYLEGCYPRCPPDKPYYNEETKECVPEDLCWCYVNGIHVPPGGEIPTEDNCTKCVCGPSGSIQCTPLPGCPCVINGTSYEVGEVVAQIQDGNICIIYICAENGSVVVGSTFPCPTSTSPTTTSTAFPTSTLTTTVTTTRPPVTTTPCFGLICNWTEWFDVSKPEEDGGDYETYDAIRNEHGDKICEAPEKIECRAKEKPDVSLEELGQKVECNVTYGLICKNEDQDPTMWQLCYNYEIRVNCCEWYEIPCETTPTPTPTSTTTSTTVVITTTTRRPTASTTTPIPTPTITSGFTPSVTTPVTSTSPAPSSSTTTTVSSPPVSTTTPTPTPSELPIRTTSTTMPPSSTTSSTIGTTTTGTVTTTRTPTTPNCDCIWTDWIDVSYPNSSDRNSGDYETFENILKHNSSWVCAKAENISCRAEQFPDVSIEDLGQKVECNVNTGLICNNSDQVIGGIVPMPVCLNYEISLCCVPDIPECIPSTTPSTTTAPPSSTMSTVSHPPVSTTAPTPTPSELPSSTTSTTMPPSSTTSSTTGTMTTGTGTTAPTPTTASTFPTPEIITKTPLPPTSEEIKKTTTQPGTPTKTTTTVTPSSTPFPTTTTTGTSTVSMISTTIQQSTPPGSTTPVPVTTTGVTETGSTTKTTPSTPTPSPPTPHSTTTVTQTSTEQTTTTGTGSPPTGPPTATISTTTSAPSSPGSTASTTLPPPTASTPPVSVTTTGVTETGSTTKTTPSTPTPSPPTPHSTTTVTQTSTEQTTTTGTGSPPTGPPTATISTTTSAPSSPGSTASTTLPPPTASTPPVSVTTTGVTETGSTTKTTPSTPTPSPPTPHSTTTVTQTSTEQTTTTGTGSPPTGPPTATISTTTSAPSSPGSTASTTLPPPTASTPPVSVTTTGVTETGSTTKTTPSTPTPSPPTPHSTTTVTQTSTEQTTTTGTGSPPTGPPTATISTTTSAPSSPGSTASTTLPPPTASTPPVSVTTTGVTETGSTTKTTPSTPTPSPPTPHSTTTVTQTSTEQTTTTGTGSPPTGPPTATISTTTSAPSSPGSTASTTLPPPTASTPPVSVTTTGVTETGSTTKTTPSTPTPSPPTPHSTTTVTQTSTEQTTTTGTGSPPTGPPTATISTTTSAPSSPGSTASTTLPPPTASTPPVSVTTTGVTETGSTTKTTPSTPTPSPPTPHSTTTVTQTSTEQTTTTGTGSPPTGPPTATISTTTSAPSSPGSTASTTLPPPTASTPPVSVTTTGVTETGSTTKTTPSTPTPSPPTPHSTTTVTQTSTEQTTTTGTGSPPTGPPTATISTTTSAPSSPGSTASTTLPPPTASTPPVSVTTTGVTETGSTTKTTPSTPTPSPPTPHSTTTVTQTSTEQTTTTGTGSPPTGPPTATISTTTSAPSSPGSTASTTLPPPTASTPPVSVTTTGVTETGSTIKTTPSTPTPSPPTPHSTTTVTQTSTEQTTTTGTGSPPTGPPTATISTTTSAPSSPGSTASTTLPPPTASTPPVSVTTTGVTETGSTTKTTPSTPTPSPPTPHSTTTVTQTSAEQTTTTGTGSPPTGPPTATISTTTSAPSSPGSTASTTLPPPTASTPPVSVTTSGTTPTQSFTTTSGTTSVSITTVTATTTTSEITSPVSTTTSRPTATSSAVTVVGSSTYSTVTPPGSTTSPPSSTPGRNCSILPNESYAPGESWWLCDCFKAICIEDNIIQVVPIVCNPPPKPTCANGLSPVQVIDEDGCCWHWECDCYCTGWGDPHYMTFDGLYYSYQGNCTYVLVEEINKKVDNFGVYIDNYHCDARDVVSCPRTLIVRHETQEVRMATVKPNTLQVEVTVNKQAVALPYKKFGLTIYESGINRVVEIPELKMNVTYNGLSFSIRMPYSLFGNNTHGQCGTCNNNTADDCMLPNGNIAENCQTMADHWQVVDPSKPQCSPGLTPTKAPITTPVKPCKESFICELLLGSVFEPCHGFVEPEKYYAACVFDSCVLPNLDLECSSLQIYAATCADQSVCIDWRSHTNGVCSYKCPSDKEYRACGPLKEPTCKSSQQNETSTKQVEGCFCPNGTMLYDSGVDVCVKTCGCVGVDKIPREFGEKFTIDCQDCICLEGGSGIVCEPHVCVKQNKTSCDGEGFYEVNEVNSEDFCCPIVTCKCNTSLCTTKAPKCTLGFEVHSHIPSGHCCPVYECVPKRVCVHQNAEFLPNSSVFVDKCQNCFCTNEVNVSTQLNIISCEHIPCNTYCEPGYEHQPVKGECCGRCVQTKCVIRTPNNSHLILSPGEFKNDPYNNCTIYSCVKVHNQFVSSTSEITCPAFNEESCKPGTITFLPNGCCKTCAPLDSTSPCSVRERKDFIVHHGCRSVDRVVMTECEGTCGTFSLYSAEANSMDHRCSCCRESKTTVKKVNLKCPNGHSISHKYIYVESCSCQDTTCSTSHSRESQSREENDKASALNRIKRAISLTSQ